MEAVGIVFVLLIGALAIYCGYLLFAKIFRGALHLVVFLWPFVLGIGIGAAVSNGGAVELGVFIILAGIVGGVFWIRWLERVKWPKWFERLMEEPP